MEKIVEGRVLLMTEPIGWENVRLFFTYDKTQKGGSFTMCPEDNGPVMIEIYGHQEENLFEALYHEVIEFAMTRNDLRLAPSPEMTGGHDTYLFVMRHYQFSEVCARITPFLLMAATKLKAHLESINQAGGVAEPG